MIRASQIERLEGFNLAFRLVQASDAEYVYGLRINPSLNQHLSQVRGSVAEQRDWINTYKQRESAGSEYYYIIERLSDGVSCGAVRLYNIADNFFTWGSWILDQNKTSKAALESAFLVYELGFNCIGCEIAVFDVRKDNEHTLNFHRRFGAKEIKVDDINVYFEYTKASFDHSERTRYRELLLSV